MGKSKEERREYERKYREAHREKLAEQARLYRRTPFGRAKTLVHRYRKDDEKTGRGDCTIDEQWIMDNIFTSKCVYCGEDDWRVLGCDRIDNLLPHTPENIVCACGACNKKRGTMPFEVFLQRLKDGESLLKKNRPDCSKAIIAINDAGEVVCEFPSIREAARNGYNRGCVSAACRGCYGRNKNSHKYRGLLWFYK